MEKFLPVSVDKPTVFITSQGANGTFDVEPFLKTLDNAGAEGMAIEIDDIMQDLTHLYMDLEPGYTKASSLLYTLRILRNALLTGGGFLEIKQ
ncbi:hypothetical protein [Pontibacter sp. SGAir0037]|uniref:hypothetical protein n=1 Tax=Pontibacter sp. SGAir0037 TaxID=2571030 RepID=UPI0010CCB459|nr:hypothetical protein [Pontibacter sp. SGAir0037]QCR24759.1 hypothetical protein C1N53_21975 [Pontibacter sp. SGAir0037]